MKHLVKFRVSMMVDSDGEPDVTGLRGGIDYAIRKAYAEGCLTAEDNETDAVREWNVQHEGTVREGT